MLGVVGRLQFCQLLRRLFHPYGHRWKRPLRSDLLDVPPVAGSSSYLAAVCCRCSLIVCLPRSLVRDVPKMVGEVVEDPGFVTCAVQRLHDVVDPVLDS